MQHIISKDGTAIAYEKTGSGPVIILIDGAMGHREHFGGRALAAELSKDFTVITYDRRGRGESTDTQPYSVDREIEDINSLINLVGSPVYLYGFSSGAVLALIAAAKLGDKVTKLAVLEPPFGDNDDQSKKEFRDYCNHMTQLLREGKKSEAVAYFLQDMIPPEVLKGMKQSPAWAPMVSVAHTLAYDHEIMGDGAVPTSLAASVTIPTLVLDGSESPPFKHTAANAMAGAMPNARRKTLEGQMTMVPPQILAPVLVEFYKQEEQVMDTERVKT